VPERRSRCLFTGGFWNPYNQRGNAMTTNWDKFNSSYNWTKVRDGDTATKAIMGDPEVQEKDDGGLSILFNVFDVGTRIHEVLRCGVILAGKIKGAIKGGALADKVVVVISRVGSGMDDTVYSVRPEPMTPETKKDIAGLELHDLAKIPLPEEKKRKKKAKKAKK